MTYLTEYGQSLLPKTVGLEFDHFRVTVLPEGRLRFEHMYKGKAISEIVRCNLRVGDFVTVGPVEGRYPIHIGRPE